MPILNHKILGQAVAPAASLTTFATLYTVPANTTVEVKTLIVTHTGSGNHEYRIAVLRDGEALTDRNYLFYNNEIATKATEIHSVNLSLSAGDVISVSANSTDVTFQAYGTEIYTPAHAVAFDVYENGVVTTIRLYGLENNLNYMKYADEDESLRIGFRGYGPLSEVKLGFGSEIERDAFMNQLEQARLYGNPFTFDPVQPIVYIGNNIGTDATTTTSTTTIPPLTTTTTSTTTTTTAAPTTTTTTATPTTTTTTAAPTTTTTSSTTTTTTLAPTSATLYWEVQVLGYVQEAIFIVGLQQEDGGDSIIVDRIISNARSTTIEGEDRTSINAANMWLTPLSISMKDDSYAARIEFYDVTDPLNPDLIDKTGFSDNPNGPGYWTYGGASLNLTSDYLVLGRSYRIIVKLQ
jgi:hypothetical protein